MVLSVNEIKKISNQIKKLNIPLQVIDIPKVSLIVSAYNVEKYMSEDWLNE